MTRPPRACAASRATRPARGRRGARHRRSRRRPRAARRPAQGLGIGALARREHPRLDRAEPRQRAVPVALPLRRRPAVLQQPRRSRARRPPTTRRTSTSTSPPGVGSCESASGGCVSLISSGSSDANRRSWKPPRTAATCSSSPRRSCCRRTPTRRSTSTTRAICTQDSPCLTPPAPAPRRLQRNADACRPAQPAQQTPVGSVGHGDRLRRRATSLRHAAGQAGSRRPSKRRQAADARAEARAAR